MNIENILSILNSVTGQHVSVSFQSQPKPSAVNKELNLKKITSGAFRAGIDFANLSTVKEGIENGERGEVQSLPWGEWVSFPYHIQHKGKDYVRLYPPAGGFIQTPKVQYFINDEEVDKDTFNSKLTPSAAKSKETECFTIAADNIISI